MSTTSSTKKRKDIWKPNEKHYCKECNCWMASDRQSILFHENARRHQNNVINNLKRQKYEKDKTNREQENLQKSLRDIERIANLNHIVNDSKVYGSVALSSDVRKKASVGVVTNKYYDPNNLYCQVAGGAPSKSDDNTSWRENLRGRNEDVNDNTTSNNEIKHERKKLGKDEGHYIIGDTTYLDCFIYAPLLKVDMPAQIWTGASMIEGIKRAEKNSNDWKTGLVVAIHHIASSAYGSNANDTELRIDFAYLKNPDDEDETLEKNIKPSRLRIIIGEDEESGIPNTLQEARLQLLGGEEEQTLNEKEGKIDENTGFSTWNTISIKSITKEKEKEIEEKQIQQRIKDEEERRMQSKEDAFYKRMEEAKYVSKDDSALGAYDVFNSGKGYKGIDIFHDDVNISDVSQKKSSVLDYVPSLSSTHQKDSTVKQTVSFGFKTKAKKKKSNIRKTNADDD